MRYQHVVEIALPTKPVDPAAETTRDVGGWGSGTVSVQELGEIGIGRTVRGAQQSEPRLGLDRHDAGKERRHERVAIDHRDQRRVITDMRRISIQLMFHRGDVDSQQALAFRQRTDDLAQLGDFPVGSLHFVSNPCRPEHSRNYEQAEQ